jgi:hypothetical protein
MATTKEHVANCTLCKKEFLTKSFRVKYCPECRKLMDRKWSKDKYYRDSKHIKRGEDIELVCAVCNTKFTAKNRQTKYCSDVCKNKVHVQSQIKSQIKKGNEHVLYYKVCVVCSNPFETYCSRQKTCCKQCSDINGRNDRLKYYQENKETENEKNKKRYEKRKKQKLIL